MYLIKNEIKEIRRFVVAIVVVIIVLSCAKPTESKQSSDSTSNDTYFVKYASDGVNTSYRYTISYTKEDGTKWIGNDISVGDHFERTIGPVPSGFEASYSISCVREFNRPVNARIEVKRMMIRSWLRSKEEIQFHT